MNKTESLALASAISLSSNLHSCQTRWDGITPYILHPIEVMTEVMNRYPDDLELAQIAILHDTIEDTDLTIPELKEIVSPRVFSAVLLLTKTKGQPYTEYIEDICENEDAIKVKLADIVCNSAIENQKGTDKNYKDQGKRWAKYKYAYDTLVTKLKEYD